jgi:hypothetical protein
MCKAVILSVACRSALIRPVSAGLWITAFGLPQFQIASVKAAPLDLFRKFIAQSVVGTDRGRERDVTPQRTVPDGGETPMATHR